MQGELDDFNLFGSDLVKNLRREMQPGSRSSRRSSIAGEDGLVALAIGRFIFAVDVWWQRYVTEAFKFLEECRLRMEAQSTLTIISSANNLSFKQRSSRFIFPEMQFLPDSELSPRANQPLPLAIAELPRQRTSTRPFRNSREAGFRGLSGCARSPERCRKSRAGKTRLLLSTRTSPACRCSGKFRN